MKDNSIIIFIYAFVFFIMIVNIDLNKTKENQLCFKYAAKKCNIKDKDKMELICNILINHNSKIISIKNHRECRKE